MTTGLVIKHRLHIGVIDSPDEWMSARRIEESSFTSSQVREANRGSRGETGTTKLGSRVREAN